MSILFYIRLAIIHGISAQDYDRRNRAHRIAARLSRRHGFSATA